MNGDWKGLSPREKVRQHLDTMKQDPKRSLGQNFLISETVIDKIVEASEPETFQHTFEVGPGLGAITDRIEDRARQLTLVEYDKGFANYWREERGFQVLEKDALKVPWNTLITEETLVVSNLPYQISSRLLIDLTTLSPAPKRLVLMFQKEVAQRIRSQKTDSDYSFLSVLVQTFWNSRLLLEAGAVDFYPKPNVASRVLVFDRKLTLTVEQQTSFLSFVKLCFEQKKKKVINRLIGSYGKDPVHAVFEAKGLDTNLRISQLSPTEIFELFKTLSRLFP